MKYYVRAGGAAPDLVEADRYEREYEGDLAFFVYDEEAEETEGEREVARYMAWTSVVEVEALRAS